MFDYILGVVNSPQFVIDSWNLVVADGEIPESWVNDNDLNWAMEDIFLFHCDMILGVVSNP